MAAALPVVPRIRVRYFLCFWLFVLSSISFMDRTNIAISGLELSRTFALNNQKLGWIFSAFLVGYASFQLPAGVLAVRFGPRRVLAGGVFLWALCNVCTALLPAGIGDALVWLLGVRCALGVAEAVMYPNANQFVARWVPQRERGIVNGLIFAGVGAGSGLTPPVLTWIITSYGWRAAFWFDAGMGALGAGVWWLIARDRPEEHAAVSAAERDEIREGLGEFRPGGTERIDSHPSHDEAARWMGHSQPDHAEDRKIHWRAMFSRVDIVAMMVSYFAYGYASWIFFSWFYLYMAEARGVNLKTSALFSMIPFLCMTVFCLSGGYVSDRLTRAAGLRAGRCVLAAVAMFLTGVFLVVGSRVRDPLTAAILLALGAGCLYFSQSSFWSVSTDIAGRNSGVFSSIVNMSCQIGAALTTSLTPWLAAHFDWKMPFTVAAGFVVVGAGAWLVVHPERALEV